MSLIDGLKIHLEKVDDPRVIKRCSHSLVDILVIVVLGVLSHAESLVEIERWANSKIDWLKKFLELPSGIPSHDTIARILYLIEPREFEVAFMTWVDSFRDSPAGDVLCIDGKVSRGTAKTKRGALNTVSVFSTLTQLVLAQGKSKSGGNAEATTAKDLLDHLNIRDCLIVGDAGIGLNSVANTIDEKGGHYIFPIKGNRRNLKAAIEDKFKNVAEKNSKKPHVKTYSLKEKGHGRLDERHIAVIKREDCADIELFGEDDYKHLEAIGRVTSYRKTKENRPFLQGKDQAGNIKYEVPQKKYRESKEVRYFITNLKADAQTYLEELRKQWRIENQLHWVLDVSFGEDAYRTREERIAQNLALARKIAFNLVKQDKSVKIGVKAKLKLAGWDLEYLEKILFQQKLS